MIGKTDFKLPWSVLADSVRVDDEEVMTTTVPKMHYERDVVIGDSLRTLVTSKLPLMDGEGQIIGVLGSYHDVTNITSAPNSRYACKAARSTPA